MIFRIPSLLIHLIYVYFELSLPSYADEDGETPYSNQTLYESIGILPIGEIIRKGNLPYLIYTAATPDVTQNISEVIFTTDITPVTVKRPPKTSTLKIILDGTDADLMRIPYKKIIKNLKYILKIDLSPSKKKSIWTIIKRENPVHKMDIQHLKNLYGLLYEIPETEYIYFNYTDWEIVDFFGKIYFKS